MIKNLVLGFLKFYKFIISPVLKNLFGGGCRFTPTCSEYAHESIKRFGLKKGLTLSLKRVIFCNPLSVSGFDPIKQK